MDAQERAVAPASKRDTYLGKPYVGRQGGEPDRRIEPAFCVKHRLAKAVEAEAASALPADGFRCGGLFY